MLDFTPPSSEELDPTYKVMGTLTPALSSVTLAPGEATPILEVSSNDVDPTVIRSFLANPSSLILTPAIFDLVDQNGVDFDFINENAFSRTALIEIDFGGGEIEVYRVATNVARSGATLQGVTMEEALNDILDISEGPAGSNPLDGYTVEERLIETAPGSGVFDPTGVRVLASVKGRKYSANPIPGEPPAAFWAVITDQPGDPGLQRRDDRPERHPALSRGSDPAGVHAGPGPGRLLRGRGAVLRDLRPAGGHGCRRPDGCRGSEGRMAGRRRPHAAAVEAAL